MGGGNNHSGKVGEVVPSPVVPMKDVKIISCSHDVRFRTCRLLINTLPYEEDFQFKLRGLLYFPQESDHDQRMFDHDEQPEKVGFLFVERIDLDETLFAGLAPTLGFLVAQCLILGENRKKYRCTHCSEHCRLLQTCQRE